MFNADSIPKRDIVAVCWLLFLLFPLNMSRSIARSREWTMVGVETWLPSSIIVFSIIHTPASPSPPPNLAIEMKQLPSDRSLEALPLCTF